MKNLSFEELLDRMQHIDPNGDWVGAEYTKEVLESCVATTLYWHQEEYKDKYLVYLFDQASLLYSQYKPDEYFESISAFYEHITELLAKNTNSLELLPDISIVVGEYKCSFDGCAAEYTGLVNLLKYVIDQQ